MKRNMVKLSDPIGQENYWFAVKLEFLKGNSNYKCKAKLIGPIIGHHLYPPF